MRRVVVFLSVIGLVVCSNALVASAGLGEPATTAYTIIIGTAGGADVSAEPEDVTPAQGICEGQLATIDLSTGLVTPVGWPLTPEGCAGHLTFAPDGTLYGMVRGEGATTVSELVTFDTTTGEPTIIGPITEFTSVSGAGTSSTGGLAFDAAGHLYAELTMLQVIVPNDPQCVQATDDGATCLYRIDDPSDPEAATFVGRSARGSFGEGFERSVTTLGASCSGVLAGVVDRVVTPSSENELVASLDVESGALSDLGDLRDEHELVGLASDGAGTVWGIEVTFEPPIGVVNDVVTVDPSASPADTFVADVSGGPGVPDGFVLNGLAIAPLDCAPDPPEPTPIVLQPTFTG